jgi:hypothetical protein
MKQIARHWDNPLFPYEGNDSRVDAAIDEAYRCLQSNIIPAPEKTCDYCRYWEGVRTSLEKVLL